MDASGEPSKKKGKKGENKEISPEMLERISKYLDENKKNGNYDNPSIVDPLGIFPDYSTESIGKIPDAGERVPLTYREMERGFRKPEETFPLTYDEMVKIFGKEVKTTEEMMERYSKDYDIDILVDLSSLDNTNSVEIRGNENLGERNVPENYLDIFKNGNINIDEMLENLEKMGKLPLRYEDIEKNFKKIKKIKDEDIIII